MPTSRLNNAAQGLDSWPPTQVRLQGPVHHDDIGTDDKLDQPFGDDDPMTYFLAPTPLLERDDDDDNDDAVMMDFDFDAGIEDGKHQTDIVRSVSPSSLEGLRLPPPRPPTPPRSPPARLSPDPAESTTDDDDDTEDYIRFGTGRLHTVGLPFSLRDFATMKSKKAAKGKAADGLLAPALPSARGRPPTRFGTSPPGSRHVSGSTRGRPSNPYRRRSPHVWREPSPDVWSIEEETEDDINSDIGSSVGGEDLAARKKDGEESKRLNETLELAAAKPKKRVRFVLPVKEDYMN